MRLIRISENVPVEEICRVPEGVCIVVPDDTPAAYVEKLFYRLAHEPEPTSVAFEVIQETCDAMLDGRPHRLRQLVSFASQSSMVFVADAGVTQRVQDVLPGASVLPATEITESAASEEDLSKLLFGETPPPAATGETDGGDVANEPDEQPIADEPGNTDGGDGEPEDGDEQDTEVERPADNPPENPNTES
jgi:hypothetical protein